MARKTTKIKKLPPQEKCQYCDTEHHITYFCDAKKGIIKKKNMIPKLMN